MHRSSALRRPARRLVVAAAIAAGATVVSPGTLVPVASVGTAPPPSGSSAYAAAPRCSATGVPTTTRYLRRLPPAAQTKATAILRAASACNSAALVRLATADRTRLSFGLPEPATELAVPDRDGRYRALVILFSRTAPVVTALDGRVSYVWPLVHVKPTAAAWKQVVTSGVMTQREVDAMRRSVGSYWGWRTAISANGTWEFDVSGD